jgi:NAD(P)-dependent dehydrogenase (short-subunit alcohol dehydrogenase family)
MSSSSQPTMQGRICVVTGANSGIGRATTLGLARLGATLVMVCRDRGRGEAAQAEIRAESGNEHVELLLTDLASQASIRELSRQIHERYPRLNVLVNNAGVFLSQRSMTPDGIETTFALNHLGYFLLTNLLLDLIEAGAPSRIVNVSSDAHKAAHIHFDDLQGTQRYKSWRAYGQSKLANVLFTYELARRLEGTGVTVNAVHPGTVATSFGSGSPFWLALGMKVARRFMLTPEQGADTVIYAASSPEIEGVTGKYFVKRHEVRTSSESYDEAVQDRLWQVSAELTHMAA